MISPHPLDRLVQQDTFAEIVASLEPEELVAAVLRLEGLSDAQIGRLLGITSSAVSHRLERARKRIIRERPDLASVLRDRRQPCHRSPCRGTPPLEHGWLCRWDDDEPNPLSDLCAGLTTQDVAQRCGVTPQTVRRWIRAGRFPHAYQLNGRRGDYRIPERDLVEFQGGGS